MRRVVSVVCGMVLCAVPVLAQKSAGTGGSDQAFVDFAAQTDMVEANLGQEAQNVSESQGVKDFGQMMVTDHTADFGQLHMAAQQGGLNVPDAIDKTEDKAMITPMEKLKGATFDKKYIHEMVMAHTAALARYKKEADSAQNPAIKSYAQTAVPVLQKHLDAAKALEKNGGK
jgi:putative membrane protein